MHFGSESERSRTSQSFWESLDISAAGVDAVGPRYRGPRCDEEVDADVEALLDPDTVFSCGGLQPGRRGTALGDHGDHSHETLLRANVSEGTLAGADSVPVRRRLRGKQANASGTRGAAPHLVVTSSLGSTPRDGLFR